MQTLQTLDYIAIVLYMVLMAGIGVFLGFFVKNISDYFRGGNAIPWFAGGISNFMTMFSTFIFVAYAGIAYEHGLVALTVIWCTVPPALVAMAFFAKRWRRSGIITPVEFLETRFNAPVRQLFSWSGVAFKVLDNMVRLYAIGIFLAAATPLSLEAAVIGCGVIVVIYTVVGGLWAVVVTDAVQFVILIFTTLILVPLSLQAVGGWAPLTVALPEHFTWFNGPKGAPLFLLAYYTMVLIKYNANWAFIQRFYSVRDERAGQKLGLLTAVLFFVFPAVFLFPSLVARELIPGLENGEMAYVSMCLLLLPEGVMGLMIAAMFAATMSSLSSEYNVTAGVLTRDIYQRLLRPQASTQESMLVARGTTLLIGALVMTGALFVGGFGGAFEANKLFTGLFGIPMAIPLVFGILLRRPQPWGALATIIIGMGLGLLLNAHPEISWEIATLFQIAVCLAVFLGSGLFRSRDRQYNGQVQAFFERLHTPVSETEKPQVQPGFQQAMARLYAVALGSTGLLFAAMSVPSLQMLSGQLSMGAGLCCLVLAGVVWLSGNEKKAPVPVDAVGVKEKVNG